MDDSDLKQYQKGENISLEARSYLASLEIIRKQCPLVAKHILGELQSQRNTLKLIASENYTSLAVQLSMGNLLTDKYSEGFPYHRFYAGCEHVDAIEAYAGDLLKKIFHCDHAYVQPHSGADANLVAFWSILVQKIQTKEVDRLQKKRLDDLTDQEHETLRQVMMKQRMLGMSLESGGHLTHGYRHNVSSKMFQAFSYGVDQETERVCYKQLLAIAKEVKPLILMAGYSAYPRLLNFAKMKEIADEVGAVLMVDMAHFSGLVAGGVLKGEENPVPFADIITSTTHKTLRGPRGGLILCKEAWKDTINRGCPLVLGGPLPQIMAAKAVAFTEVLQPTFSEYAHQVVENAKALALALMDLQVKLFTSGTDNHLVVIDVKTSFGVSGRIAEQALLEVGITVNRNMIPGDPNGPWYTSGLRIGTPALTSRGMKTGEMQLIAKWIVDILKDAEPASKKEGGKSLSKYTLPRSRQTQTREEIKELLQRFPLYPELQIE